MASPAITADRRGKWKSRIRFFEVLGSVSVPIHRTDNRLRQGLTKRQGIKRQQWRKW